MLYRRLWFISLFYYTLRHVWERRKNRTEQNRPENLHHIYTHEYPFYCFLWFCRIFCTGTCVAGVCVSKQTFYSISPNKTQMYMRPKFSAVKKDAQWIARMPVKSWIVSFFSVRRDDKRFLWFWINKQSYFKRGYAYNILKSISASIVYRKTCTLKKNSNCARISKKFMMGFGHAICNLLRNTLCVYSW